MKQTDDKSMRRLLERAAEYISAGIAADDNGRTEPLLVDIYAALRSHVDAPSENATPEQHEKAFRDVEAAQRSSIGTPDDYEVYRAFYWKYAMGSLRCPSCLLCGQAVPDRADWAIQHAELPDIYICKTCVGSARSATLPRMPSEEMADAVRGVLQIIRNTKGATFDDVRRHCEARGDDTGKWPLWVQDAEGYVTEQGAAMMIFEIMDGQRYRSASTDGSAAK